MSDENQSEELTIITANYFQLLTHCTLCNHSNNLHTFEHQRNESNLLTYTTFIIQFEK